MVFARVAEAEGYATMFVAAGTTVLAGLLLFLIRPARVA
jgi:hypothetical protein